MLHSFRSDISSIYLTGPISSDLLQNIDNMPKDQPPRNQKTPPRRNMTSSILAALVGALASVIRVRPLNVTILADSHGIRTRLGRWGQHMSGPNNLFRIHIETAPGLTVSELLQTRGRGFRLLQTVYQQRPNICIVALGGNDVSRHYTLGMNGYELGQHLMEVGTLLQERNIIPMWLEIPPPRQSCCMPRGEYQQVCYQANNLSG